MLRSRPLPFALLVTMWVAAMPALATWAVVVTDTTTGEVGIGQATGVAGIDLRGLSAVIVTGAGVATVQAAVDSSGVARATIRDELLAGRGIVEMIWTPTRPISR